MAKRISITEAQKRTLWYYAELARVQKKHLVFAGLRTGLGFYAAPINPTAGFMDVMWRYGDEGKLKTANGVTATTMNFCKRWRVGEIIVRDPDWVIERYQEFMEHETVKQRKFNGGCFIEYCYWCATGRTGWDWNTDSFEEGSDGEDDYGIYECKALSSTFMHDGITVKIDSGQLRIRDK